MRLPLPISRRPGLSLLEVLVAMAIFLLSIAGIAHLVTTSAERALEVEMLSETARLSQSKMAQVQSGEIPLSTQGDTPFEEAPAYTWSLTVDPGSVNNLWNVTVRVARERSSGGVVESKLSQLMLDPSVVGSTQDILSVPGSDQSSGGAADPGSTGGNPGGSAGGGAAGAKPGGNAGAKPAPSITPAPVEKPVPMGGGKPAAKGS